MQIKMKELKQIVAGLQGLFSDVPGRGTAALEAFVLGQRLLKSASPDPVDVVPVQDYPFPLPTSRRPTNIPDVVKPCSEGPE